MDTNENIDTNETKLNKQRDNRLFPGTVLYCEGRERSALRGRLHLYACLSFFPMLLINYLYVIFANEKVNLLAFFACFTNFLIIFIAHCISAYYHITELPIHLEIIAQKMDIIGANLYVASSYLPMTLLLFPLHIGIPILTMVSCVLGWNIYYIINSKYNLQQIGYLTIFQVIFGYYLYKFMTREELGLNCIGILSLAFGSIFLFIEIPYLTDNKFFSNFEAYHSLSLVCLSTICLMNYSIFMRSNTTS